jgi:hypothetical protein
LEEYSNGVLTTPMECSAYCTILVQKRNQTNFLLEIEPMKESVETAVKLLAEKITADVKSDDAMRFTQAALNLAHVLATIYTMERKPTIGKP